MEDLEPICYTEQASFCVELMKRLNMQRGQNYLCDITLVAKEGKEFKAHRNVLSAASPFFAKLLQSDMKEKDEGIIRFKEISASVMEDVLEFIYTGSIEINEEENAKELMAATDYFLLTCLKTVCGRFLEKQMSISNCISTFYFAEKYQCEELISNSRKFTHDNFASVAELDEFLNLEAGEVERWISSDDICVAAEEDVFKIIQRWIEQSKTERAAKFEALFRHVRLVFVSRDYLLVDVVTNQFVRENFSCLRRVSDAIELVSCASEDTLMQSPGKRIETHGIVVRGGKYTCCYLPEQNSWKRLADGLSENAEQMIKFRDQLYSFPEYSKAEKYDPIFNSWARLDMAISCNVSVVLVRGQIYALEINCRSNESTVKRYDVELYSWQTISSCEGSRVSSCVVGAGNCLYVCSGGKFFETQVILIYDGKAERFDTVEDKWESIADMQQHRGHAFGVAAQGKIFIAGGLDRNRQVSKTCEVYNVATNEWHFIANLNFPRILGSMVCLNETLYVLGGSKSLFSISFFGRSLFEFTVESYDPTVNEWIQKTSIPVNRIAEVEKCSFKGCVLRLSKGVLDQLD